VPELPEVETIARGLQRAVAGQRILNVTLGKTDFIDNPDILQSELAGRNIVRVERYGKFMLLQLSAKQNENADNGQSALLVHLGMTGLLMPARAAEPQVKHTHVIMQLSDGRELRYIDPRRFGRIAYLSGQVLEEELRRFGLDPLEMSLGEFSTRIHERNAMIKALLLDQSVLRGVGNIYADESLWKAQIHPAKQGCLLKLGELRSLYVALQKILQRAILLRGSSISDFMDVEGIPGEYQQHHRAYGREGKLCFRCKSKIRRIIVAGRSSYFCPNCQIPPRGKQKPKKRKKERVLAQ
jgi:formamidopyrimidine-DNA glycosylase